MVFDEEKNDTPKSDTNNTVHIANFGDYHSATHWFISIFSFEMNHTVNACIVKSSFVLPHNCALFVRDERRFALSSI